MKKPVTWIVTADGSRARFYRLSEDQSSVAATEERLEWSRARGKSEDIMTDRAGFRAGGGAPGGDAAAGGGAPVVPETDPKEVEKERFHDRVAERMREVLTAKRAERFVLVADPKTLGSLRGTLPGWVRDHVVAEIDKDYTETAPDTLLERVRPHLPSTLG
jgi:protein required for attachment to host cells